MRLVALQWGNGSQLASVELLDLGELHRLLDLANDRPKPPVAPALPADPPREVELEVLAIGPTVARAASRPRRPPRKAQEAPRDQKFPRGAKYPPSIRAEALARLANGGRPSEVARLLRVSHSLVNYWRRAASGAGRRSGSRSSSSGTVKGSSTGTPAATSPPKERSPGARSTASGTSSPVRPRCFRCGIETGILRLVKGNLYCPEHAANAIRNGA